MTDVKTILLIGRSGRGKSTLANVVTNTSNFKESSGSVSETKKIQLGEFAENDLNYRIIDTPGIGDTKMSDSEVLDIIAEAVYLVRNGLSQVFFVTSGRFDQHEMATYDLLRTIIFDKDITKHTTIVRTRFADFRKPNKCGEDINSMVKEAQEKKTELEKSIKDKEKKMKNLSFNSYDYQKLFSETEQIKKELTGTNLAEILESCQGRVIYVDNPSVETQDAGESEIKIRRNKRVRSRKIVLEHLSKNCREISYRPPKMQELSEEIVDYMEGKIKLEEELKNLKTEEVKVVSEQNVEKVKNKFENVLNIFVVDDIKDIMWLEEKKTRLQKEIAEKEKVIRQKVLKHIFNNYDEIDNKLGGDIFLDVVTGDYNWPEVHSEFTKELAIKWLSQGFTYEQTKEWTTALGNSFDPKIDADFCAWLRDVKELTVDKVKMSHAKLVEQLRQEYTNYLKKETEILDKHNHQLGQKIGHKEVGENIRNILLIGRTGNGKSTLANVLVNKNGKFEEVFKEGAGSTSETRDFKSEEFEENGIKYRVIDTMGFGSTSLKNLSQKHVLDKTKDLIFLLKEGVNQILFVSDGRFSKEEIEGYNYLKEIVFGEDISQYTTVVRTNSPEREIEKLYKDLKKIIRESEQIISCQDIIYVDNPPISASIDSDESEEDKRGIEAENGCSIEKRKESRRILLNHLEKCQKFCGLQSSKNLNLPFDKRKNEIQKKDSELEEKSEQINFLQFQVQELTDLIKKQKEKILEAYIYFAPEKELLQGLIKVHLEYSKAKKQKLPAIKIRKQRDKILNAIEDKLNKEEDMEEIEAILIDCEELVSQELELEAKLKGRSLLIEDGKQNPVLQIIDSSEERKNVELEKKELVVRHLEEKLKLKEEFQKREKELLDALIAVKNLVTEKEQIKDKLASKKEIQELKNQLQEENTSQQTISIKENNQVEAQQLEVPKMHWGENK